MIKSAADFMKGMLDMVGDMLSSMHCATQGVIGGLTGGDSQEDCEINKKKEEWKKMVTDVKSYVKDAREVWKEQKAEMKKELSARWKRRHDADGDGHGCWTIQPKLFAEKAVSAVEQMKAAVESAAEGAEQKIAEAGAKAVEIKDGVKREIDEGIEKIMTVVDLPDNCATNSDRCVNFKFPDCASTADYDATAEVGICARKDGGGAVGGKQVCIEGAVPWAESQTQKFSICARVFEDSACLKFNGEEHCVTKGALDWQINVDDYKFDRDAFNDKVAGASAALQAEAEEYKKAAGDFAGAVLEFGVEIKTAGKKLAKQTKAQAKELVDNARARAKQLKAKVDAGVADRKQEISQKMKDGKAKADQAKVQAKADYEKFKADMKADVQDKAKTMKQKADEWIANAEAKKGVVQGIMIDKLDDLDAAKKKLGASGKELIGNVKGKYEEVVQKAGETLKGACDEATQGDCNVMQMVGTFLKKVEGEGKKMKDRLAQKVKQLPTGCEITFQFGARPTYASGAAAQDHKQKVSFSVDPIATNNPGTAQEGSGDGDGDDDGSNAAGPVIGTLLGLCLVGGLVAFLVRKRSVKQAQDRAAGSYANAAGEGSPTNMNQDMKEQSAAV